MQYLLVAEADKIQVTLFRATKLAEIIGGSRVLTEWCYQMAQVMLDEGVPEEHIIVADGGAFRVIFDSKGECLEWGERLAESYSGILNGTLSVTRPLEFQSGKFNDVLGSAQRELGIEKNNPRISSAS